MIHLVIRRATRRRWPLTSAFIILLLMIGAATAAVAPQPGDLQGCPEPGQGGDPDLNRLKNRSAQVSTTEPMTVAQINALPMPLEALRGKHATWPASTRQEITPLEHKGVMVEAFLIGVKQEGPETTNCRRQDLHDSHLWMVDARDQTRAASVVVEMTPRWLAANDGWRLQTFKHFAQQRAKMRITGWLMCDPSIPIRLGRPAADSGKSTPSRTLRSSLVATGLSCNHLVCHASRKRVGISEMRYSRITPIESEGHL
jgi:hypothetical protein